MLESLELEPEQQEDIVPTKPAMAKSLLCTSSRRVRFDEHLTIMFEDEENGQANDDDCEHDDWEENVGEADRRLYWYTQEDYNAFRAENLVGIQHYRETNGAMPQDEWIPRGFEYIVERYPRKRLRLEHSMNILHFQQVLNYECPLALADYACNSSSANGSLERAQAMALVDEEEAILIHAEGPFLQVKLCKAAVPIDSNPSTALTKPSQRGYSVTALRWSRTMLKLFRCIQV